MGKTENSSGIIGRLRPRNTPAPERPRRDPIDIHELSHFGSVALFPEELIGALRAPEGVEEHSRAKQSFGRQSRDLPKLEFRGQGMLLKPEVDSIDAVIRPDSPEQPVQYLVSESYRRPGNPTQVIGYGLSYWAYDPDSDRWLLLNRWNAFGDGDQISGVGPVFDSPSTMSALRRSLLTSYQENLPVQKVSEWQLQEAGLRRQSAT